jgi:hypothetical protein
MGKPGNNGENDHAHPPDELNYGTVFEKHDSLMKGYKSVLKNSISARDSFCIMFVESHIYKKLKMLRKIYSVEIATFHDSNTHRKTLNDLVEHIDKFQRDLSYFPNITFKGVLSIIVPILTAIAVICSQPKIWSQIVAAPVGWWILFLLLLTYYCVLFFVWAVFSFVAKRRLFISLDYKGFLWDKSQKGSDKRKTRWNAFSEKESEGTIYDKENKLFKSLNMRKIPEQGVDIYLIQSCIMFIMVGSTFIMAFIVSFIDETFSVSVYYLDLVRLVGYLLGSVLIIFLTLILKRRAR